MISDYVLYQGDCLDKMSLIDDSSVNLICTDLPYGTTNIGWDVIIPFEPLWEHYRRVLTKNGTVLLFGNQPFTSKIVMSNPKWFKQCLVWNKNKCGSPGLAKYRPMQTHEDIVVFSNGKGTYNPIMEVGEAYFRAPPKSVRVNSHGYGFTNTKESINTGTRYPKSIINISRDFSAQQQVHPTQKPVPLLEWLITTYSNVGDTVLDSTCGSGTSGVAAINLGRKYIGIDLSEDYIQISDKRIAFTLSNRVESVDSLFGE